MSVAYSVSQLIRIKNGDQHSAAPYNIALQLIEDAIIMHNIAYM